MSTPQSIFSEFEQQAPITLRSSAAQSSERERFPNNCPGPSMSLKFSKPGWDIEAMKKRCVFGANRGTAAHVVRLGREMGFEISVQWHEEGTAFLARGLPSGGGSTRNKRRIYRIK